MKRKADMFFKKSVTLVVTLAMVLGSLIPAFSRPVFANPDLGENQVISMPTVTVTPDSPGVALPPASEVPIQSPNPTLGPIEEFPQPVVPEMPAPDNGEAQVLDPKTTLNSDNPIEEIQKKSGESEMSMNSEQEYLSYEQFGKNDNAPRMPKNSGEYQVDESTGSFTYSYPLDVPPGRNGMQPQLLLNYHQRRNDSASIYGYGWDIQLPYIERSSKHGIDSMYMSNDFTLSMGGQDDLVPLSVNGSGYGTYGKLIESDFMNIEYHPNGSWIITDKLGTIYTFGLDINSRQADPSDGSKVFKWLLTEMRDTNDNYVRYEYYFDSGQVYPKRVVYTGHGAIDGPLEVHFEPFYSGSPIERDDIHVSYRSGYSVQTKYRVDSIQVFASGVLTRKYDLSYQYSTSRQLLTNISHVSYADSGLPTTRSITLQYTTDEGGFTLQNFETPFYFSQDDSRTFDQNVAVADLNGDGLDDLINITKNCPVGDSPTISASGSLSNGNGGFGGGAFLWTSPIPTSYCDPYLYTKLHKGIPIAISDVNGDNRADLLLDDANGRTVRISDGSQWVQSSISHTLPLLARPAGKEWQASSFGDLNGDGFVDAVSMHMYGGNPEMTTLVVDGYINDRSGNLINDPDFHWVRTNLTSWMYNGGLPLALVDINYDGLADLLFSYDIDQNGDHQVANEVYLSTGSAFQQTTRYSVPTILSRWNASNNDPRHYEFNFTDINGDGIYNMSPYEIWPTWDNHTDATYAGVYILSGAPQQLYNMRMAAILVDLTGDGLVDMPVAYNTSLGGKQEKKMYVNTRKRPDILKSIHTSEGADIRVDYQTVADQNKRSGNNDNELLPFNLQVVKNIIVGGTAVDPIETSYIYKDGGSFTDATLGQKDVFAFATVDARSARARWVDTGNGIDGIFNSTGDTTITSNRQYESFIVNAGHRVTVESGVIIKVRGSMIVNGILETNGKGYIGGSGGTASSNYGWQGDSPVGVGTRGISIQPYGGGGGGGQADGFTRGGGGGGGYATDGFDGVGSTAGISGKRGLAYGDSLITIARPGSGGGGGNSSGYSRGGAGGSGGGYMSIVADSLSIGSSGYIQANGQDGFAGVPYSTAPGECGAGGGGGSGGAINIRVNGVAEIGTNRITALGGAGGLGVGNCALPQRGGDGAVGWIRLEAHGGVNGTSDPAYTFNGDFDSTADVSDSAFTKHIRTYAIASNDGLFMHGKLKQDVLFSPTGAQLIKDVNQWAQVDQGNSRKFVTLTQKIRSLYDGSLSNIIKKTTASRYTYNSSNGNQLTEERLGEVLVDSQGGIVDTLPADDYLIEFAYASNGTKHILAAPKNQTVSKGSVSRLQNVYYDNLPQGQVDHANPTKEEFQTSETNVTRTFNSYGLANSETDPNNNTTNTTYDAYQLYPHITTNASNQTTTTTYSILNGKVTESIDPNGAVTKQTFDGFGRLIKKELTDPAQPTQLNTVQEVVYNDAANPRSIEQKDYFAPLSYRFTRTYIDALGRTIQTKKQLVSGYATVDTLYDSQGRVSRTSLPYSTSGVDYSAADMSKPATTYTYDALDRVLTETNSLGTTTHEYDGWTEKVTDAGNHPKWITHDAYGNIASVKEKDGANEYTTSYEYNLSNKLTKITDSLGNIRNFVYNDLDRLESQDMVHASSESNPAVEQYFYDAGGNLIEKISFTGADITYTYDALNRVLTENQDGMERVRYTYDQGEYGIGRLSSVVYANGDSISYTYDARGRIIDELHTISTTPYSLRYEYNDAGALTKVVYPDDLYVRYAYNVIGQTSAVYLNRGANEESIAVNIQYNPNDQMVALQRANGIATNYTYDPAQLYRLTNVASVKDNYQYQDTSYVYSAVGNIESIIDASDTELQSTKNFTYDDLNRLLSATVQYTTMPEKNYSVAFTYDAIGNMTSNSLLGAFQYASTQPHQLTSIATSTDVFAYDAAGNQTKNGMYNLSWDWRNRLDSSTTNGSYLTQYRYDQNDQRYEKLTLQRYYIPPNPLFCNQPPMFEGDDPVYGVLPPNRCRGGYGYRLMSDTRYINKYYETGDNETTKHHIYLGTQKLATLNDVTTTYFVISDHLGSNALVTDSNGATQELTDYQPFGAIVYTSENSSVDNHYRYTGKELDSETALQYFGARYMDNSLGRFTSVDLATLVLANTAQVKALTGKTVQDFLADPQLLNSYSYTRNNPLLFVDPDGNVGQHFNPWSVMLQGQRQIAQFMQSAADHAWSQGSLLGYSSSLVAGALGGVANSTADLLDPGTKPVARMLAFGSLALDVASGGEGKLASEGAEILANTGRLSELPRAFTAGQKLEKFARLQGVSVEEFLARASEAGRGYLDTRFGRENINIYVSKFKGEGFLRVTLDSTAAKIISAGMAEKNQIINRIRDGVFKSINMLYGK